MKEVLKSIDKSNLIITILLRTLVYIGWFSFAYLFLLFIHDSLTDDKIFYLVLWLMGIYVSRNLLKYFYRKFSEKSYHNLKHSIEMHYFEKLRYIKNEKIG